MIQQIFNMAWVLCVGKLMLNDVPHMLESPSVGSEVVITSGPLEGKRGRITDIHPGLHTVTYQIWVYGTGGEGMFSRDEFEVLSL